MSTRLSGNSIGGSGIGYSQSGRDLFRQLLHPRRGCGWGVALILDIDLKPREQPSVADEVSIR